MSDNQNNKPLGEQNEHDFSTIFSAPVEHTDKKVTTKKKIVFRIVPFHRNL